MGLELTREGEGRCKRSHSSRDGESCARALFTCRTAWGSIIYSHPAEDDGISVILVEAKKWYSFNWATTKEKAKLLYLHLATCFHLPCSMYLHCKKCLASSAYYLDKNIQLHEIIEYIYSSVYGDILNTSEKQQCLEGVVLEGSASIGFRHPDHTNPFILLILEIKGLPHITKWNNKMLQWPGEMHFSQILKCVCEQDDDKSENKGCS